MSDELYKFLKKVHSNHFPVEVTVKDDMRSSTKKLYVREWGTLLGGDEYIDFKETTPNEPVYRRFYIKDIEFYYYISDSWCIIMEDGKLPFKNHIFL